MAVTVKKITLWRKATENQLGVLANTLLPLASAGADLKVVMGYRLPGEDSKAVIEIYPVIGKKSVKAAGVAGLSAASTPALLVEGDNKSGLGQKISQAIADSGISLDFLLAQVVGRKYSAVFGFRTEEDVTKSVGLIRKAAAGKKKK